MREQKEIPTPNGPTSNTQTSSTIMLSNASYGMTVRARLWADLDRTSSAQRKIELAGFDGSRSLESVFSFCSHLWVVWWRALIRCETTGGVAPTWKARATSSVSLSATVHALMLAQVLPPQMPPRRFRHIEPGWAGSLLKRPIDRRHRAGAYDRTPCMAIRTPAAHGAAGHRIFESSLTPGRNPATDSWTKRAQANEGEGVRSISSSSYQSITAIRRETQNQRCLRRETRAIGNLTLIGHDCSS